jgi:sulfite reductase (NADPH) flavoprotein alpha-component
MSKVNILWASMFGTAEDVANDVFDSASNEEGADIEISQLNDVTMDSFKDMKKVIVISSTTGQGDVPTNGEEFFDNLSKSDIDLSGGPKKIDKRMEELGANKIVDTLECDGDDEGAREYSIDTIKKLIGK